RAIDGGGGGGGSRKRRKLNGPFDAPPYADRAGTPSGGLDGQHAASAATDSGGGPRPQGERIKLRLAEHAHAHAHAHAPLYSIHSIFTEKELALASNRAHVAASHFLAAARRTASVSDWQVSHGSRIPSDRLLVLENLARGFKQPSIIDIKLGARLWADDALPAKRARLDEVARGTTSGSLGFRIAGMKVWRSRDSASTCPTPSDGRYQLYDRWYGRSLTPQTTLCGLQEFLSGAGASAARRPYMAARIATRLRRIAAVLQAEETRMYSSSVLIIYEGDPHSLEAAIAGEPENER
ncbi:hypothetical protein KEM52_003443, partial [Ascosphaera acerosa]